MDQNKVDPNEYPSVNLAYEIGLRSYDYTRYSLDAVDQGLDALRTWATTITLGVIVLIASKDHLASLWDKCFLLAISLFGLVVLLTIIPKWFKTMRVISPEGLYNKWLHYSEWEFKKNTLYWAGDDFKVNMKGVRLRGHFLLAGTVTFFLEVAALVLWVVSSTR